MTSTPNTVVRSLSARLPGRFGAVLSAALCASLWLAWVGSMARAAADDDDDDDELANPPPAAQNQFILVAETFDQWIFGGTLMHNPNNNAASQMDQRCQAMLDMRIDAINRVCTLSDPQKTKLRLAAAGDIKRFCDQYDQLKQKYSNTRQDPNNVNQVFAAIQPLRQQWQSGILGDQSLFQKVMAHTLEPEQNAAYQQEETARTKDRYQAKIKLAIASLDNTLGLSDDQRQQFEKLLLDTPPPNKVGQYDYYYVFWQVAKLPNEKLKSIFDARQLKLIQQINQRSKGYEFMLKQQGAL